MRVFMIPENWGPLPCEHPNCPNKSFMVQLSKEESDFLPETGGEFERTLVIEQNLGAVKCEDHLVK